MAEIQVENHPQLKRDPHSKCVKNYDQSGYQHRKLQKQQNSSNSKNDVRIQKLTIENKRNTNKIDKIEEKIDMIMELLIKKLE